LRISIEEVVCARSSVRRSWTKRAGISNFIQAFQIASAIEAPDFKASALSNIAVRYAELEEIAVT
jgi:hypothetical protein